MDRENVISGLEYTKAMFLFDPATGYTKDPDDLNPADKTTFDACVGAIDLLKDQEEREKRICNEICTIIRGSCCTDTDDDKEFVCHEIQKCFTGGQ